jgi:hypothetical protein
MESFLKSTSDPAYGGSFKWGRSMGVLEAMADHITRNAPKGGDTKRLRY